MNDFPLNADTDDGISLVDKLNRLESERIIVLEEKVDGIIHDETTPDIAGNIKGGLPNNLLYQVSPDNTEFIPSPTVSSLLQFTGSIFKWIGTIGSGSVVLQNNAKLITPDLGVPSAIDLTNATNFPENILNDIDEERIHNLENIAVSHTDRLSGIDSDISDLDNVVTENSSDIATNKTDITELSVSVEEATNLVDVINSKVDDALERIATYDTQLFALSNSILMWNGSSAELPQNFYPCDGNNGTPDLMDKFIVGAGWSYGVNENGSPVAIPYAYVPPEMNTKDKILFYKNQTRSGTLPAYYALLYIKKVDVDVSKVQITATQNGYISIHLESDPPMLGSYFMDDYEPEIPEIPEESHVEPETRTDDSNYWQRSINESVARAYWDGELRVDGIPLDDVDSGVYHRGELWTEAGEDGIERYSIIQDMTIIDQPFVPAVPEVPESVVPTKNGNVDFTFRKVGTYNISFRTLTGLTAEVEANPIITDYSFTINRHLLTVTLESTPALGGTYLMGDGIPEIPAEVDEAGNVISEAVPAVPQGEVSTTDGTGTYTYNREGTFDIVYVPSDKNPQITNSFSVYSNYPLTADVQRYKVTVTSLETVEGDYYWGDGKPEIPAEVDEAGNVISEAVPAVPDSTTHSTDGIADFTYGEAGSFTIRFVPSDGVPESSVSVTCE